LQYKGEGARPLGRAARPHQRFPRHKYMSVLRNTSFLGGRNAQTEKWSKNCRKHRQLLMEAGKLLFAGFFITGVVKSQSNVVTLSLIGIVLSVILFAVSVILLSLEV
jgi:hypothetical protein